ncbi:MAG: VWA domain-containing protein [Treponema sp.]|nr:VWA domain-containing protein [Treponema sp.]
MMKKRGCIAVVFALGALLGLYGQNAGPIDLILLLDTSSSMSNAYQEVNSYISGAFLKEFLRTGDTFHLIAFSDRPRLEISRRIEGRGDVETIIGRMFLQYPLDPWSDIPAALGFAEQYAASLPSRPKKIVLVSDGTAMSVPGSSSSSLDAAGLSALIAESKARLDARNIGLEFVKITPGQPLATPPVSDRTPRPSPPEQTPPASIQQQPTQPAQTPPVSTQQPGTPAPSTARPAQPVTPPDSALQQPTAPVPSTARPVQPVTPPPDSALQQPTAPAPSTTRPAQPVTPPPDSALQQPTAPAPSTTRPTQMPTTPDMTQPAQTPPVSTQQPAASTPSAKQPTQAVVTPSARPIFESGDLRLLLFIGLGLLALIGLGLGIFFVSRNLHASPNRALAQAASPRRVDGSLPLFVDHTKDFTNQAANQPQTRSTPYTDRPPSQPQMAIDSSGPFILNLFVEDQNTFIGKRNIHALKSGYSLSIGGGKSDFLIFLVPVPPRIAEVRRDGSHCIFIPRKPQYFPDLGAQELHDCIGKTIRVISDHNYQLLIKLERYEDPLIALNQLLNSLNIS